MTTPSSDAIAELDAHFAERLIEFSTGLIVKVNAGELSLTEARTMHDQAAGLQQVARAVATAAINGVEGGVAAAMNSTEP